MKLEIKQITSYIPYSVDCILRVDDIEYKSSIVGFSYFSSEPHIVCKDKNGSIGLYRYNAKNEWVKPILRPLSDLTKDIHVNGEDFVPYEHHVFVDAMTANEYLEYLCEAKADLSQDRLLPYSIVQLLFEWHFDVFGLIEKGLAIDINTINPK